MNRTGLSWKNLRARRDVILPLSKPVKCTDGRQRSEIFMAKGTNIIVSAFGANCNPGLWGADSYEWKPERWLSPLPEAVVEAHMPGIYSHLRVVSVPRCVTVFAKVNHRMTFMGGSRACMCVCFVSLWFILTIICRGFKFSQLEMSACAVPSSL